MVQTPAGGTLGAWGGQIAPRVPPNPLPETPRVLGEGLGVPRACRVPATSFPGPASPFLHPPFLPPWIPSFPLEASAGRRRNPGRKAAGAPWLTAPGDSSQPKFPALPYQEHATFLKRSVKSRFYTLLHYIWPSARRKQPQPCAASEAHSAVTTRGGPTRYLQAAARSLPRQQPGWFKLKSSQGVQIF